MPTAHHEPLILDTHVWVWLLSGDKSLSKETALFIEQSAAHNLVFVPAISVWEVGMLHAKKRLTFSMPFPQWIKEALSIQGIRLSPLSPEVSIESCQLPGEFHGDSADRMIVATARVNKGILLTHDRKILDYSMQGYVKTRE